MSYCIKHEGGTWHTKPEDCPMCQLEAELAALREDSAGRMRRIEKLTKLCYEYNIQMEKVLDTGLDK